MGSDWELCELGDFIEVQHGFAFSGHYIHDEPRGDLLITPGNVAVGGGFNDSKRRYYDGPLPDGFELREGELIVTMTDLSKNTDTLGYAALVPKPPRGHRYLHNQRIGKVVIKNPEAVYSKFLLYLMRWREYRNEVLASATGTTVKHTSPERIARFRFRRPPMPEQRAIAHILGTLDDKIELNRRMSETLEAIARAIFKSWFVDFEPVRAKAEGRDLGLPPHIADLFPDRLVASELGEIPAGWEVGRVDELCLSIENGGTPKRMEPRYWGGPIPWFKTGELTDGPLLYSEEGISADGLAESSCKLWPVGTILIALYASPTVGRLGILEMPGASNQACSALWVRPDYGNLFLFYELLASRDRLQQIAVGAAQQNISQQVVRAHKILVPPCRIARQFQDLVESSYRRRVSLGNESRNLDVLRDTLLPELLSGELRLKEAERVIGRAV